MHFDLKLWRLTAGLRGRIAWSVVLGLSALCVGITRFVFLGRFLAGVFRGDPWLDLAPWLLATAGAILIRSVLDHARTMYESGRPFDPEKVISHSITQVYVWGGKYELARQQVEKWRAEHPANKYAIYFAPLPAILTGDWEEARRLLDEATALVPDEPMIVTMQGVVHAAMGQTETALDCMNRACTNPKSFGHAHHTYYQIACTLSLLNRIDVAFEWLERSVDTGFACWPFFLRDPCLKNLRRHGQFELLVSSLQAKYPDHLGLL